MATADLSALNDFALLSEASLNAKAWPFEEARKLIKRIEQTGKQEVLFETGYGPSGLPHIGTFGEVARTTMVRTAFRYLTKDQVPTRMISFSDDMDGMRKVPGNVPNAEMMEAHLGKPLTKVPNPFASEHESFAHHNNAMLRGFLDSYGFDYEFASATEYYESGRFDDMLVLACERYQKIMDVMLPTLGEERQATYSPFLPISPTTGEVLYVPMKDVKADGMITFEDADGTDVTVSVKGGNVKMQWKPDFGMRWAALGVDYEMFGKDHQANAGVYGRICKILGTRPPENYVFELFLDDKGEKISKTKGNGISIDEWLTYASPESLALFMYQKPRTAKRLYFDVIPKAVDEYATFLGKYPQEEAERRVENPVFHIHSGQPPVESSPLSFSLLLNLVSAANAEDKETLWGFITRYAPEATPESHPLLEKLAGYALNYYRDFVKPTKKFRTASASEAAAMGDLAARLREMAGSNDADALQTATFDIGKAHNYENLREWFKVLYQVLLGQDQGPRFGIFVAAYGPEQTADMIDAALAGEFV